MSIASGRPRRPAPASKRKDHGWPLDLLLNALLAAILFAPLVITLYRLLG